MCDRFVLSYSRSSLIDWYKAKYIPENPSRFNIAPGTNILVVRDTPEGRVGSMMRWGLIPYWAKVTNEIPLLNNALAESITSKPMFKNVFRKQRCIIPASGFYEWKLLEDEHHKQPHYISTIDYGSPMSFAGIWDSATINDVTIESCSIITTQCNDLMRPIHDRMPVILPYESIDVWLKPEVLPDETLNSFLKPYDSEKMQAWTVSANVNKASNQDEQLIQPLI